MTIKKKQYLDSADSPDDKPEDRDDPEPQSVHANQAQPAGDTKEGQERDLRPPVGGRPPEPPSGPVNSDPIGRSERDDLKPDYKDAVVKDPNRLADPASEEAAKTDPLATKVGVRLNHYTVEQAKRVDEHAQRVYDYNITAKLEGRPQAVTKEEQDRIP